MTGTLPIGFTPRYSDDFMLPYSTILVSYGAPASSSIQRAIRPRDIGFV